jgi:tape measure domain-containing protein
MANNDISLGIRIRLDGREVDGEVRILAEDMRRLTDATREQGNAARDSAGNNNRARDALRDQGNAARDNAGHNNRARDALRDTGSSARDTSRSLRDMARDTFDLNGALRGLVGGLSALALYQTAKSVIATADSMKLLDGRIKVATSSAADYAFASQELVDISMRTHTAFDANATLFARVNKSMETMGGTVRDTTALTETMAQAIRISGASAGETSSVVRQLSQALASGVLRGDEFNSIMENGSRLAYALADGIGVNVGALRKMAENGELTAGRVIQAIMSQSAAIDAEYKKIPLTVGAALENIRTAYAQYISDVDAGAGATTGLAESLDTLANNLTPVLDSIVSIGKITLIVFGGQMVAAMGQYIAARAAANAIERAHAAAITMDLERTVQLTAATLALAQANHAAVASALAATEADIASTQARLAGNVAMGERMALTNQLNILTAQQTAQTAALTGATASLTAAQEASAAALAAQNAGALTLMGTLRLLLNPLNLLNAGIAILVGWEFGKLLNQFEWVRKLADEASIAVSRLIENASYAWNVSKLLFSGNLGDIDRLRATHSEVMVALDEEIESHEIRKKSMEQVAQMEEWLAESGAESAIKITNATNTKTDAQKKAADEAKKAAADEVNRRDEIAKTLAQIEQETALIGLSSKERQRAVELTQALTAAKGAEADAIKTALEHKWSELDADERRNEMWAELVRQANALDKLHDDAAEAKRLARLADELKTQGLSNEAIKERIDLEKELAGVREANPDLDPKQVESYVRDRHSAEQRISAIMDNGSKSTADYFEAQWKRAAENVQDALSQLFEDLLNGDATRSFDSFLDNVRRSITKVFAQDLSLSIQNWMQGAFTKGNTGSTPATMGGGFFDWLGGLFGGSSGSNYFQGNGPLLSYQNGSGFGGMFSSLFSTGSGGGFSMSGSGGGGFGWGALASLANLIPGAGSVKWEGNQQNKSLETVVGMENMVTDMVGNFFPLFKLVAPLKNMIMNFGADLFPDRKPSLMGHMLGQAFGPLGDLLGTFLMGSKIPQPTEYTRGRYSDGRMTVGKSEAFEGGNTQNTIDFTTGFGNMITALGHQLNMTFRDFSAEFWHQLDKGGDNQFASFLNDKGGNFMRRHLSEGGDFRDLANEASLAVIKRNIASQDDLHYRQAVRDSNAFKGLSKRIEQIDKIGLAIGEYGPALQQLKAINAEFDDMATKAHKFRFAEADVEAARQRAIEALKNDTITAFRQLAGLGPTLAAQLADLGNQLIALEANARTLKIAESDLLGLRAKAIALAKEQYLSPLTDVSASITDQIAALTGVLPQPEDVAPLYQLLAASTDPTEQARYIERIQRALTQRYNIEIAAINKTAQAVNGLKEFVDSLKLSNLSPLDPEQRLREAQGQYGTTLLKAQAGDQSAIAKLPDTAQAYLTEARSYYASTPDYAAIFSNVTDTLSSLGASIGDGSAADAESAAAAAADTLAASLHSLSDLIKQIVASQGSAFDQQSGNVGAGAQGPAKNFQDLTEDQMAANIDALPDNASKAQRQAVQALNKMLARQIKAWLFGGEEELAKTQAYQELTTAIKDIRAQIKTTKKSDPQRGYLQAQLSGLLAQRKALGKVKFKEAGGWTQGLTIVGENGPELINFARPTQVQSNRQTQSIIAGGNDKMVAELQKANEELAALVRLQVKANQELLERLDRMAGSMGSIERKTRLAGAA